MAIRYKLVDKNNNEYALEDGIYLVGDDKINNDIKITEKSFQDGGVFSGINRLKSKDFEFEITKNFDNDNDFLDFHNEIIYQFSKAVYLYDILLSRRTSVIFDAHSIKYEKGSYLRFAENTIKLKRINPFWENINYNIYNIYGALPTEGTITITNNGSMPAFPVLTINAGTMTSSILFHVLDTNAGMYINDLQFGNIGLTQYIVNNENGRNTMGGIKRNEMILFGTGFFSFPVGSSSFYYYANGIIDITIEFRERFFI